MSTWRRKVLLKKEEEEEEEDGGGEGFENFVLRGGRSFLFARCARLR